MTRSKALPSTADTLNIICQLVIEENDATTAALGQSINRTELAQKVAEVPGLLSESATLMATSEGLEPPVDPAYCRQVAGIYVTSLMSAADVLSKRINELRTGRSYHISEVASLGFVSTHYRTMAELIAETLEDTDSAPVVS